MKRETIASLLISLLFVSLGSMLQNAFTHSVPSDAVTAVQTTQFRAWPDKPQYHIGETVFLRVEPTPAIGVTLWFVITAPDKSQTKTPALTPGRNWIDVYANKLLGTHRADLWSQVVVPSPPAPQLVATCYYEIVEVYPGEVKYRGTVEWTRPPDYGVTVTRALAGRVSEGDRTFVTVYGSGQKSGDILEGRQVEVLGERLGSGSQYQVNVHEFWQYIKALGAPILTLQPPEVSCPSRTVTVNGDVHPGTPGATIVRKQWDWGDGSPLEDAPFPAKHTYAKDGTYTITVTAYDSNGLTTTKTVTVIVSCGTPPRLTLSPPVVNCRTVTVQGAATATTSGTRITRIHWDWGDGRSEDLGPPGFPATHTYAKDGTYAITVTAYDSNGLSATQTQFARVACAPTTNPLWELGTDVAKGVAAGAFSRAFPAALADMMYLPVYGLPIGSMFAGSLLGGIIGGIAGGLVSWGLDQLGVKDWRVRTAITNVAIAVGIGLAAIGSGGTFLIPFLTSLVLGLSCDVILRTYFPSIYS